jgi:nicotinate-nucleotide--dimethylbenzimidazole phosphoribosyltransferase
MSVNRSLISPTSNLLLEQALRQKLERRAETTGSLGELEPLAVRLGLIQNTLKPRFRTPQLAIFAADHGLAVEGLGSKGRPSTAKLANQLLTSQLPVAVFARIQGLELSVVDCGVAEAVAPHTRLLARKIAHGTRNARVTAAMSLDQAHAAIRAGMEIADSLVGNAVACAGIGVGAHESGALVLSRLSGAPLSDLLISGPDMEEADLAHLSTVLQGAQARHKDAIDPVEVLAAFGGFEMAVMVGVMLVAGSKRHLIIIDGMPACAHRLLRLLPQPQSPRAGRGTQDVPRVGPARARHGEYRRYRRHARLAAAAQRRRTAHRGGGRRGTGPDPAGTDLDACRPGHPLDSRRSAGHRPIEHDVLSR